MPHRIATTVAALAAAAIALSGCASPEPGGDHAEHGSSQAPSGAAADVAFAAAMIPHHEQAVEMADIVLAKPDLDPRVADLAERIRAAQEPEIATMRSWLEAWGAEADAHGDMDHGDDGMLTEEELAELETADGATASTRFLEGMIAHHEGAVAMAQQELDDGEDPDALALAASIVDAQQREIDEMRTLLDAL